MRRFAILSLAVLAFAGCAVGPDYRRPTVDSPPVLARDGRRGEESGRHRLVGAVRRPGPRQPDPRRAAGEPGPPDRRRQGRGVRRAVRLRPRGPLSAGGRGRIGGARTGLGGHRQRPSLGDSPHARTSTRPPWAPAGNWTSGAASGAPPRPRGPSLSGARRAAGPSSCPLVGSVAGSYVNLRDLDRQLEIARETAKSRGESMVLFRDRFEGGIVSEVEYCPGEVPVRGGDGDDPRDPRKRSPSRRTP